MIKNYFKIAWRNLWRNKIYSAITISGLSLAMAGAILLLLWIQNTLSVDQFHSKGNLLYRVYKKTTVNGYAETREATPTALAPALVKDHQEIKASTRVLSVGKLFANSEKKITATGNIVDPAFLNMFSFPLERGDVETALNTDHSVVITEGLAKKLFPRSDAMNKTVLLDADNFVITGIVKDLPNNTQFNFEFLLPWKHGNNITDESWESGEAVTYVELDPLANEASVNNKISDIISRHHKNGLQEQVFLYRFKKAWLYGPNGGIKIVRLLFIVAFILLFIGSINFMNLSTARGEQRAKEVGVRKIAGANKKALIKQFIGESILLAFIAGIIALVIAEMLLPSFNNLTEKHLVVAYHSVLFWIAAIGFVLFTGLLAGSYPAFYLSSFKAINVLKKAVGSRYAMLTPRKILVVVQFTVAVVMINYSYILIKQTAFMMNRQTGFVKDDLIFHPMTNDLQKNYDVVKQELLSSGKVIAVNKTSSLITSGRAETNQLQWNGNALNYPFQLITSDANFVNTNGLKLLAGRDIDMAVFPADTASCIINETAAKALGVGNAVGQVLKENGTQCTIVGLVKDFVNDYPGQEIKPLMIRGSADGAFLNMRLESRRPANDVNSVSNILRKYNPGYITDIQFADYDYAKKFKGAEISITLATGFTLVTIFISCLGLFGLGIFMVTTRTKEIGIRKVLGAGAAAITWLLSRDFVKLVMIAILIASPIAWLLMKTTVQNFAYRINVDWWVLLATGLLAIAIALITVSFRSIRAALANPVKSLRTE